MTERPHDVDADRPRHRPATDVGRVREANEDALLAVRPDGARDGQVLVAVADGMGGHKAGEVASALAVESLRQRAGRKSTPTATADALLPRGVELGNRTIWDAAAVDLEKEGMGTTLVCALLTRRRPRRDRQRRRQPRLRVRRRDRHACARATTRG